MGSASQHDGLDRAPVRAAAGRPALRLDVLRLPNRGASRDKRRPRATQPAGAWSTALIARRCAQQLAGQRRRLMCCGCPIAAPAQPGLAVAAGHSAGRRLVDSPDHAPVRAAAGLLAPPLDVLRLPNRGAGPAWRRPLATQSARAWSTAKTQ